MKLKLMIAAGALLALVSGYLLWSSHIARQAKKEEAAAQQMTNLKHEREVLLTQLATLQAAAVISQEIVHEYQASSADIRGKYAALRLRSANRAHATRVPGTISSPAPGTDAPARCEAELPPLTAIVSLDDLENAELEAERLGALQQWLTRQLEANP